MIVEEELYLEHYGKRGMKWGIRRNPHTGVRPLAATLTKSKLGDLTKANYQSSLARSSARRQLSSRQQRRLVSSVRVSEGRASTSDMLRVVGHQSLISIVRGHGIKGAASRDAQKLEALQKRLKSGNGLVKNSLRRHGGDILNFGGTK